MNVIIIGGGIAGLTTAIALKQRGIRARVFEAARGFGPAGKGIWMSPNAMQVLQRLGLARQVADAGVALERVEIIDQKDGLLQTLDLRPIRDRFGHTTISIHRAALHRILQSQLSRKTLRLGKPCRGVTVYDDAVVARFQDGSEAAGDLLIGADGLRSFVRSAVEPGSRLRYSGQSCYLGVASLALPEESLHVAREIWGGAARFGYSAIGPDQVYWYAPFNAPARGETPVDKLLDELLARYADFPDPALELIRHTPPENIIRTDLFDLAPLTRWWRDRVVLVGDAAHAMTPNLGQGAAQAMEDAWVLAQELARGEELNRALAAYQQRRQARVNRVVKQSRGLGKLAHQRYALIRKARNALMRSSWQQGQVAQDLLWLYGGLDA